MIRSLRPLFPPRLLALSLGEVIVIGGCFLLATLLRLRGDAYFMLNFQGGYAKIAVICFVCMLSLYFYDLYDFRVFANRRELVSRTPQVVGTATIALGLLYYMYPPLGVGRSIFATGTVLLCVGLVGYRVAFLWLNRLMPLAENTLVLGEGPFAWELAREIRNRPERGLRLVGLVSENGWDPNLSPAPGMPPVLGSAAELERVIRERGIHRLVVAMQDRRGKLPVNDLLRLKARRVAVEEGIEVYESLTGKIALAGLTPAWLLFAQGFAVSHLQEFCLRLVSVGVAGLGLLVSSPLMLALAALIKLDSRGPVFFRQERVGENGRTFQVVKFRSMRDGAEADTGPVWARHDDPRVTRVGRWMRKWRLDELPQFFNVLSGDMNLVGTRPERPCFVEDLRRKIPFYDYRHVVKPGITGWAQIKYHYADSEMSTLEKLQYDLFYCKNRSLGLDLLILFHTAKIVLLGRGSR